MKMIPIQELPNEFNLENPFADEQVEISINSNLFQNRKSRSIKIQGSLIETIFSDFEAFSICRGLEDRHARHIARKFFERYTAAEETHLIEAHKIANEALKKYGEKL